MTHPFDALIALEEAETPAGPSATGPRSAVAQTHPAWANMVGPYGGATAAQALAAVLADPRAQGRPAALTVNFAAPVADGPLRITVDPVRTNRSNQHWTVLIDQDDAVVLTGTVLLSSARDTFSETELTAPEAPAPESLEPAPFTRGLAWIENYEFRMVHGLPTAASDSSETLMWVSQADPRPWDHCSLAAAADVFFPRIFARTGGPTPAGTITYTVYFHVEPDELAAQGPHVLCRASASRFHSGLFDQVGHLWGEDGKLLVTTTQLVYFKGV